MKVHQREAIRPTILAMDLEGTLISNAVSQIPRPGLYNFLQAVDQEFEQLVIFTTVPQSRVHAIARLLAGEGAAPPWFAGLECIRWSGATKDLRFISPTIGAALLLDDHHAYVHPGQEYYWIEAPLFASPYDQSDTGLDVALQALQARLSQL